VLETSGGNMKKITLLFIIIFAAGLCIPMAAQRTLKPREIRYIYYPSGKIKMAQTFINGVANGRTIHFYEDGTVKYITPVKNGKINGVQYGFFNSGKIKTIIEFVDNKPHGRAIVYREDGTVMAKLKYENGQRVR
jgi:antitoxin component YwqK of YwqJK toxin-antitoxin module